MNSETGGFSFMLKPSGDNGVGIFAMHDIADGTHLMLFAHPGTKKIPVNRIEDGSPAQFLIERFGIREGDFYWAPKNFNCMDIGWYLNHSEEPSAIGNDADDTEYFATRDILAGEEITVDYRLYSPEEAVAVEKMEREGAETFQFKLPVVNPETLEFGGNDKIPPRPFIKHKKTEDTQ